MKNRSLNGVSRFGLEYFGILECLKYLCRLMDLEKFGWFV